MLFVRVKYKYTSNLIAYLLTYLHYIYLDMPVSVST